VYLKAGFGFANSYLQKESELGKKYAEGRVWNIQLDVFKKVEENVYFQTGIRKSSYAGIRKGYQPIPHGLYKNVVPANFGFLYGDVKEILRADYVEVPVLIRFVGGRKLQYFVNMGPSLNWTIDAVRKAKGNTRLYYDEFLQTQVKGFGTNDESFLFNINGKQKIRKEMQNFMLGFRGGWGFSYPLASGLICIESSLFVGYMPVELQEGWDGRHVPSSWDINIGYIINLKK
jgi:hypothetical protein